MSLEPKKARADWRKGPGSWNESGADIEPLGRRFEYVADGRILATVYWSGDPDQKWCWVTREYDPERTYSGFSAPEAARERVEDWVSCELNIKLGPDRRRFSVPVQLLNLVWNGANAESGHSWERLNRAMSSALSLAIGSGMAFRNGDVGYIEKNFRPGYWLGESGWMPRYAQAIRNGNKSFVNAIEADLGWIPVLADEVEPSGRYGLLNDGFLHRVGTRKRERLAVGFEFPWKGHVVRVTSMADGEVIACSYTRTFGATGGATEKLKNRFRITAEDIRKDRAERKERAELIKRLRAAGEEKLGLAEEIWESLGVADRKELEFVDIVRLRLVAERYAPKEET